MSDYCYEPNACNYSAFGQCEFESCLELGCTDEAACNYDASALYNDGSCEYVTSDCNDAEDFGSVADVDDLEEENLLIKAFSPPLTQTIDLNAIDDAVVKIIDINGRLIFNEVMATGSQSIVQVPSKGIFLILANKEDDGTVQSTKLFVN